MHLYILTRGIKHDVDRFINDLQAQYFPWKMEGQPNDWVQLGVRPVQFWELVVPKEYIQTMMRTLWYDNNTDNYQHRLGALRKLIGAKKIPPIDPSIPRRIIYKDNVSIYPIGIKEDKHNGTHEVL